MEPVHLKVIHCLENYNPSQSTSTGILGIASVGNYTFRTKVERCGYFEFKLHLARNDRFVQDAWPTFEKDLNEYPDYTIACIGLAMYRSVALYYGAKRLCSSTTEIPKIYPRLCYFATEKPIGTIDTNST
uniref:MCM8 N-terminal domain-containing protein n=1 Tax=Anopheles maculatus TaxID=74869 RepID=A0A182SS72_9DIPT